MSFQNEFQKFSNGIIARKFLFLVAFATVAFFGIKDVSASMTLEDFTALTSSQENFPALFNANSPITKAGLEMWDYAITPCSGACDYNVSLFSANGIWSTGDGSFQFYTTDFRASEAPYAYGYTFSVYEENLGNATPDLTVFSTALDAPGLALANPVLNSSMSIMFLDDCSSYQTASPVDPYEYLQCGTSDPTCSPISATSIQCTQDPPVTAPVLSCTFDFSAIPDWTDPLGMFTGFFSELFSWFGCGFNSIFSGFFDFFNNLASSIGDFFTDLFSGISGLFDDIKAFLYVMTRELIVPSDTSPMGTVINDSISGNWALMQTKFADFFTIYNIMDSAPASASNSALYTGELSLNGNSATMNFDPFHTLPIPPLVPQIISIVSYLGLGWFLIRKSSELFTQ